MYTTDFQFISPCILPNLLKFFPFSFQKPPSLPTFLFKHNSNLLVSYFSPLLFPISYFSADPLPPSFTLHITLTYWFPVFSPSCFLFPTSQLIPLPPLSHCIPVQCWNACRVSQWSNHIIYLSICPSITTCLTFYTYIHVSHRSTVS